MAQRLIIPLTLAILAPYSASALTEAQIDSLEMAYDLNEIVVTGTLTPKSLKDTPVQTRLITSADIRRSGATDLPGLLQQELPGVEFSYAMNQQTNMNLAGFAGQNVLILVDGQRLAGETMDNVDFSRLNPNNIARVEIIRGAASALYGSNANGGVINIITKEPDKKFSANVKSTLGSHADRQLGADIGCMIGKVSNTLDIVSTHIDTYSVCDNPADECDFRTVYGFSTFNISDRISYKPTNDLRLTARAGYYFKERLYNPDIPDRYRDFSGALGGEWAITSADNLRLNYIYDQYDKSDYLRAYGLDIRDYSNVQHTFKALYNHQWDSGHILTAGADMTRDWLDSYQFASGETHSQYLTDVFAQYDWRLTDRLEIVVAARWDMYSDGDLNRFTPKVNCRYRIGQVNLRGGYAQGFRAPTLKEKYMRFNMADIFDIHGNPNLSPEMSHNINLSAEYSSGPYYLTAGANYNLVDNRITTSTIRHDIDGNPYIDYINIKNLRVLGCDITARAQWTCGLGASVSYNYTHEQTYGQSATQYCPARPHSATAKLSWSHLWRVGWQSEASLSARALSSVTYPTMLMYEPYDTRSITSPGYTICRLTLSQQIVKAITLSATIDNLLNYKPRVYTFNSPVTTGTTIQVGINIAIDQLWN